MRAHIVRFLALAIVLTIVIFAAAGSITPVPTGQWAGTTALAQARSGAASVLLPDGRILITGGTDASGNALNSVELFNTDGSVTAAAPMSVARSGHSATVLYTGDVLVAGGTTSGGGFTNSAELYDALNNRWSNAGVMVDARAGHTAVLLPTDGSVILAGGDNSGGPVAAVERYDMYSNTFSYAGALATARSGAASALLNDGRVLVAGGRASDANGNVAPVASTELFDPASGSATAGPAMAGARADLSATTLLDGTVLLAGGNDGSNDLASTEIFDPVAGAINPGASMSAARSAHQAFLLPNNNSVLLVGGTAAGQALASAELYVPWTNSSAATGSMTAARTHATGAPMQQDGLLLVAAGDQQNSADLYGFATVKTDNGDYAPGEVVTITGSGWKPGETVNLTLVESPNLDTHAPLTAVADANGNIFNNQFAPDEHDLNVRFYLTAVGSQSQAENSFTDATPAKVNFKATGLPGGVTLSVSYNGTNNGDNPTSGSASFTTPGTSADVGLLPSSSLSFTFPASVTTGGTTYNFNGSSPSSPLTTGASGSTTAVTGTYVPACTAPSITTGPANQTVTAGQTATFSVTAAGTAPLTYAWTKNPSTSVGTNNNSFTTAPTTLQDSGSTYKVTVSNACSSGVTSGNATLTVNPVATSLAVANASGTYGGTTTLTATLTASSTGVSNKTIAFTLNGASVGSAVTDANGIATLPNVSIAGINASATPYAGYVGAIFTPAAGETTYGTSSGSGSLTVNKATLTVTADDQSRTYGDANPSLTFQITGYVNGDTSSAVTTQPTCTTTATASSPVSPPTYPITCSGAAASNYSFSYVAGALTINARAVTVTADAKSKYYGDADPALTYQITSGNLVNGDTFTGALTRTAGESVAGSPYAITQGTLALSTNYALTYVGAKLTIEARPVTVTADAKSKYYGDADPALTYQITSGNLVNGDTFTGALTRDAGESVGQYNINQGTLALSTNYALTYIGAKLTIQARPVTVTADAKSKYYGDADPALTYQITSGNLVNGDTFTGALTRTAGESVAGSPYAITQGTLALSTNYALTYVGANLTINARPVTVTADAKSKYYGDSDPALTYKITSGNLVNSDTFSGALTRAAGENVGSYAIQQGTLALNSNYTLTYVGANLTISPRMITVTADAKTKILGAPDPALTYHISSGNLVNGDMFTGALTRVAGEAVGTYAILQGTLALSTNYSLTYVGANLTITYAPAGTACLGDLGHSILQPINADGSSVFKQGSTTPAKFRVCDANGVSIGTPGVVTDFHIIQVITGTVTDVNDSVISTTPDTAFRWDPTAQQWIYNVSTKPLSKNTTYVFRISLNDGSIILFQYGLR